MEIKSTIYDETQHVIERAKGVTRFVLRLALRPVLYSEQFKHVLYHNLYTTSRSIFTRPGFEDEDITFYATEIGDLKISYERKGGVILYRWDDIDFSDLILINNPPTQRKILRGTSRRNFVAINDKNARHDIHDVEFAIGESIGELESPICEYVKNQSTKRLSSDTARTLLELVREHKHKTERN